MISNLRVSHPNAHSHVTFPAQYPRHRPTGLGLWLPYDATCVPEEPALGNPAASFFKYAKCPPTPEPLHLLALCFHCSSARILHHSSLPSSVWLFASLHSHFRAAFPSLPPFPKQKPPPTLNRPLSPLAYFIFPNLTVQHCMCIYALSISSHQNTSMGTVRFCSLLGRQYLRQFLAHRRGSVFAE